MIQKPILLNQLFSDSVFSKIKDIVTSVKNEKKYFEDNELFFRKYIIDHEGLQNIHQKISHLVSGIIEEKFVPSYNFVSIYGLGLGECPVHIDRPQCQLTVDVCVNQNEPWPLYVDHRFKYLTYEEVFKNADDIKQNSVEYLLNPGQALLYSGTHHPHWRNKIQKENYCDMIFFHFIKPS